MEFEKMSDEQKEVALEKRVDNNENVEMDSPSILKRYMAAAVQDFATKAYGIYQATHDGKEEIKEIKADLQLHDGKELKINISIGSKFILVEA